MKKLFLFLITISCTGLQAQNGKVVISTNPQTWINSNPASDANLVVEGSITVRDKIYAGGNSTTLGDPGKPGQVLVSQGANLPPRWRTLNIPTIEAGAFYLIYNNAFTDYNPTSPTVNTNQGILLTNSPANIVPGSGNDGPYELGILRSAATGFTTISGLTKQFDVFSNQNQVYVTFEAMAQVVGSTSGQGVDFVCGIFVGNNGDLASRTLRGIRKATVNIGANSNPFVTFTQIALADGLAIGKYDVEVACKRTANYNSYPNTSSLAIGTFATGTSNLGKFASQTSLKVEVYEIPTVFNDVVGN